MTREKYLKERHEYAEAAANEAERKAAQDIDRCDSDAWVRDGSNPRSPADRDAEISEAYDTAYKAASDEFDRNAPAESSGPGKWHDYNDIEDSR